jgi:tetratricopeptide (TPR) repeat protein
MNENTVATRCPECGAALDTGARKNAAKRAKRFMHDALKSASAEDWSTAISYYGCAIELATEAARPDIRAEAHWKRGDCYENRGDNDIALLDYEEAHKFDPEEDAYLAWLVELRESERIKKLRSNTEGET